MKELLGIRPLHTLTLEDVKRDLLFFDKLYIVGLKEILIDVRNSKNRRIARPFIEQSLFMFYDNIVNRTPINEYHEYLLKELGWLIAQGKVVMDKNVYRITIDDQERFNQVGEFLRKSSNYIFKKTKELTNKKGHETYSQFISLAHELEVKNLTMEFNLNNKIEAYPTIDNFSVLKEWDLKKQEICRVVINRIPVPSELNDWEKIFEFRNDAESHGKLMGLRNWLSEMSYSNLSVSEIEEKLEYLLYKYEKALELHKLKTNQSWLETIIVGGAEVVENIAKLKLSKIAKKLFKFKNDYAKLLEIELKSEGSQLAYITKAKRNLG